MLTVYDDSVPAFISTHIYGYKFDPATIRCVTAVGPSEIEIELTHHVPCFKVLEDGETPPDLECMHDKIRLGMSVESFNKLLNAYKFKNDMEQLLNEV